MENNEEESLRKKILTEQFVERAQKAAEGVMNNIYPDALMAQRRDHYVNVFQRYILHAMLDAALPLREQLDAERVVPLCGDCAGTWFTARNTLQPEGGCIFCEMQQRSEKWKSAFLQYGEHRSNCAAHGLLCDCGFIELNVEAQ